MATQYIILSTKQAALQQSGDWWAKVLGRAKTPIDVTAFLAQVISHPTNGTAMVVVTDWVFTTIRPLLTTPERNSMDSNLKPATDSGVVSFLAAVAAARPQIP